MQKLYILIENLVTFKVNIELLKENSEIFEEVTDKLADKIELWRGKYNLDTQNAIVSTLVFKAAIEITGQHQYQSQNPKKPRKYKIDKELRRGLRTAKRNYKNQSTVLILVVVLP